MIHEVFIERFKQINKLHVYHVRFTNRMESCLSVRSELIINWIGNHSGEETVKGHYRP